MSKEKRIDALIQTIQADSHWEIIIRPADFKKERIPKLSECWNLIENCRITLRGWDYPHVDRNQENRTLGEDWIASWCELFKGHQEFWKFFLSGQFVHYLSFWETDRREEAARKAESSVPFRPEDFKPSGYISVLSTLYTLTEIFEFASCLANKGVFGGYIIMTLKMLGIKDRLLFMWDPIQMLHGCYSATQSSLEKLLTIETPELISNSAEIALDTTLWFFERFQWLDPPKNFLVNEQTKLLKRRPY